MTCLHFFFISFIRCGNKIDYSSLAIIAFSLIVVTLATIIYCYAHVLKTIRDVNEDNSSFTNSSLQLNNIEKKILKKILTYILVFILQYIPILIYNIFGFLGVKKNFIFWCNCDGKFNTIDYNWFCFIDSPYFTWRSQSDR